MFLLETSRTQCFSLSKTGATSKSQSLQVVNSSLTGRATYTESNIGSLIDPFVSISK